ncbi:MAG: porin family protein [Bacteroidaceae bacterium]|nr:porin family protein [Bacteroidaceae bacterium]
MRNWEDIIKDKLEGYEHSLPEGSLADFRKRLDEARKPEKTNRKRTTAIAIAATIAACLLMTFIVPKLMKDEANDDESLVAEVKKEQKVSDKRIAENEVKESVTSAEEQAVVQQTANAVKFVENKAASVKFYPPVIKSNTEEIPAEEAERERIQTEMNSAQDDSKTIITEPLQANNANDDYSESLVRQAVEERKPTFTLKTGAVGGGVLAASLLGSLLSQSKDAEPGDLILPEASFDAGFNGVMEFVGNPKDIPVGSPKHSMPLKAGLSIRYRLTEKLSLTSGIEYSVYNSTYKYLRGGKKNQRVQYLGVPLRLDYSIVGNRWLDVYVGMGGAADVCLSAERDGKKMDRDGLLFSLQGAGGVQVNLTNHLGVFLEPQAVWAIPSSNSVLETYRTEHPLSFNLSTGIRLTLNGK